jgi:hypothetical protein
MTVRSTATARATVPVGAPVSSLTANDFITQ